MKMLRREALSFMLALVVVVLAAVVVSTAVAAPGRLRVMPTALLTVRGTGFQAGERVLVAVEANEEGASKRVTAGAGGGFTVRFPTVEVGACPGYSVRATGNEGTRALLSVRAPECPQPKQP
jgi:hypothetical protein